MKKPEYIVKEIYDNDQIKYGVYYNIEPDKVQEKRNVPYIEYANLVVMCVERQNAEVICLTLNLDHEISEKTIL
jgi:hypothetical protein